MGDFEDRTVFAKKGKTLTVRRSDPVDLLLENSIWGNLDKTPVFICEVRVVTFDGGHIFHI